MCARTDRAEGNDPEDAKVTFVFRFFLCVRFFCFFEVTAGNRECWLCQGKCD